MAEKSATESADCRWVTGASISAFVLLLLCAAAIFTWISESSEVMSADVPRNIEHLVARRDLLRRLVAAQNSSATPVVPADGGAKAAELLRRVKSLTARLEDCQAKLKAPHAATETNHWTMASTDRHNPDPVSSSCATFREVSPADFQVGVDAAVLGSIDREPTIAIVVVAYNRPVDAENTLRRILSILPKDPQRRAKFRLFASQDSFNFPEVTETLQAFAGRCEVVHMVHHQNISGGTETEYANGWEAYLAISHHYEFILGQVFSVPSYHRVIFVEDDLILAHDFFDMMLAMSPLLDEDSSLYCVSGFNDNGKAKFVGNASMMMRSDFFPGLGWMMSRALWAELQPKWPAGFWDDWLRQPQVRRGRSCIRPEVSRSKPNCRNGGEEGVSQGLFCEHIEAIVLFGSKEWLAGEEPHARHGQDNSPGSRLRAAPNWEAAAGAIRRALRQESYDRWMDSMLANAVLVHGAYELAAPTGGSSGEDSGMKKLGYASIEEFAGVAQMLDIMDDTKDGVPRTAYRGVVTLRMGGGRQLVHLFSTTRTYA
jgi:alpha-1,3-mannosyl-glycoprotein beta-1,2-N-acetylglucosaminyltransferase